MLTYNSVILFHFMLFERMWLTVAHFSKINKTQNFASWSEIILYAQMSLQLVEHFDKSLSK